jgi:hypothetical protein
LSVKLKILITCLFPSLFYSPVAINAQILKDTASLSLLKKGVDYIYNYQFNEAGDVYRKISLAYPDHPIVYLFKGVTEYWENYPLLPYSPACISFEETMKGCIELCEKKHNPEDEPEYLLADLCARGMLLLFYNANDLSIDVIHMIGPTYLLVRRSFDFTSYFPDFLYFTGLYNYYREAFPDAYPIYKPLALLFPKGDKEKGLTELQTAALTAIELKAESYSLLSYISTGFENNYRKAVYYSKSLHDLYPENLQYMADYIKGMLLIKQYDEAEKLISTSKETKTNPFYQAQVSIFNGILQEKKYHNNQLAQEFYTKGVKDITLFGVYGNEFEAYGYFGLSRISQAEGDKNSMKAFRKKALEIAEFKKIDFDE